MKVGKKLLSWDTCDITENEVKFRLEQAKEDGEEITEEEARKQVYNNPWIFQDEWDSVVDWLTEILKKKNKGSCWKASVVGFGWRKLNGMKFLRADNGKEFLQKILPDCDCTFYVHNYGRGLAIHNYHHDSPTGEWYYIVPCSEKTYKDNSCH